MYQKFILVTGSNGFIGKNLILNLKTNNKYSLLKHTRKDSIESKKKSYKVINYCALCC